MKLWVKNYQKYLLFIIPLVLLSSFFFFNHSTKSSIPVSNPLTENPAQTTDSTTLIENKSQSIFVDIKGEILNEGVYEMEEGDRVIDLVAKAGGELSGADMTAVNKAQKLQDEMVIMIPPETSGQPLEEHADTGKININNASPAELESIPGIGPSKAAAIVNYREENGYFTSIEEIMNISGIGEKTFDKLKESISTY
ncbi:helix-hairpin-helix domain-containing protein [Jeotgalibacillus salarius]|uniref:Helix-hairpin-helix DNA-binding motif class 1 domain-containing protein n=1 Tax=Jeotgalibacillus salarius TaxID=546023 RepID=A0A4Y8LEY7_9BACL|nr:helix-hairpin-helix domain-containing protein [Jeotgalibacillus salarius]TFE01089.1 hypothetical protein E2626_10535 [Jeotgalibacillus salarius]